MPNYDEIELPRLARDVVLTGPRTPDASPEEPTAGVVRSFAGVLAAHDALRAGGRRPTEGWPGAGPGSSPALSYLALSSLVVRELERRTERLVEVPSAPDADADATAEPTVAQLLATNDRDAESDRSGSASPGTPLEEWADQRTITVRTILDRSPAKQGGSIAKATEHRGENRLSVETQGTTDAREESDDAPASRSNAQVPRPPDGELRRTVRRPADGPVELNAPTTTQLLGVVRPPPTLGRSDRATLTRSDRPPNSGSADASALPESSADMQSSVDGSVADLPDTIAVVRRPDDRAVASFERPTPNETPTMTVRTETPDPTPDTTDGRVPTAGPDWARADPTQPGDAPPSRPLDEQVDVTRLVDRLYDEFEGKLRVERERRGL